MHGGSTTSILVRIPGEAASVTTCVDGYAIFFRRPIALAMFGIAGALLLLALKPLVFRGKGLRARVGLDDQI